MDMRTVLAGISTELMNYQQPGQIARRLAGLRKTP